MSKPGGAAGPESVSSAQPSSERYLYRRVEAQGIVRSIVRENDGRLTLNVAQGGRDPGTITATAARRGRRHAAGFAGQHPRRRPPDLRHAGRPVRVEVLRRAGLTDVEITEPPPPDPFKVPIRHRRLARARRHRTRARASCARPGDRDRERRLALVARRWDRPDASFRPIWISGLQANGRSDVLGFVTRPTGPHPC